MSNYTESRKELIVNDLTDLSAESMANLELMDGELYFTEELVDTDPQVGSLNLVTSDGIARGLNKKSTRHIFTVEVSTSGWSNYAPYTKTISVPGMLATDDEFGIVSVVHGNTPELRSAQDTGFSLISMIKSNNGSITITCDNEVPTAALTLSIKVVR